MLTSSVDVTVRAVAPTEDGEERVPGGSEDSHSHGPSDPSAPAPSNPGPGTPMPAAPSPTPSATPSTLAPTDSSGNNTVGPDDGASMFFTDDKASAGSPLMKHDGMGKAGAGKGLLGLDTSHPWHPMNIAFAALLVALGLVSWRTRRLIPATRTASDAPLKM